MNDDEVDRELSEFGKRIRSQAEFDDAARALQAVRDRAGRSALSVNDTEHGRHRYVLVAAAVLVVIGMGGVAVLRDRGDSVRMTTPTTSPTSVSMPTQPTIDDVGATTPPVSTTGPPDTATDTRPPDPAVETVRVADVVTDAGPRPVEEIFHGVGVGLGYEDCGECDPVTPWGPVATADGRVVIADELNRRWVVGERDGSSQTVAYPNGFRAISPPVIGPDGDIYIINGGAGGAVDDGPSGDAVLTVFTIDDLATPVRELPIQSGSMWFDGSDLLVNGRVVLDSVSPPAPELPTVEWRTDGTISIVVTWNGVRRTWEFGVGVSVGAAGPAGGALPDGSVLVINVETRVTMRLFADGTAVQFTVPAGSGFNGSRQVSVTDVVQYGAYDRDDVSVVRVALPPASPSRSVTMTEPSYRATGDAAEICRSADIAASPNGYEFDSDVVADTTTVVDGTEWRWLVCAGTPESGSGLTVLVSDDSRSWRLTSLGGSFRHAGDRASVAFDGARATVRWQSMVGEALMESTTTDLGATWAVSDPLGAASAPITPTNGCDRPPPGQYDDFGSVHTIVEGSNAANISIEYHVPLGAICPGAQIDVTMLVANSSGDEQLFAPGFLLLSQGMPKWSFGDVPDTAIPPNESVYITVHATIPDSIRPGIYELWARGYDESTVINVQAPSP